MKKKQCLAFCACTVVLHSQEKFPKLYLEYDQSGNQILSDLVCINCPGEQPEIQQIEEDYGNICFREMEVGEPGKSLAANSLVIFLA